MAFRLHSSGQRLSTFVNTCSISQKSRSLPFRPHFYSIRNVSTSSEDDSSVDNAIQTILDEQLQTTKSKKPKGISEDTLHFQHLITHLFKDDYEEPAPASQKSSTHRAGSAIEKLLMNMVLKNRRPNKQKAPLPRGMLSPIYGKMHIEKAKADERKRAAWQSKHALESPGIVARDKEVSTLNTLLESKTSHELLQLVVREIDIDNAKGYPPYYARLLAKAIEHSSLVLRDPYLAIAIFQQAKATSVESYVSGCTVEVYNAMLQMRWNIWRDVHGMVNLVEEMTVNGVGYDDNTRRIVRKVIDEVDSVMRFQENGETSGFAYSMDEQRAVNLMKALVAKWLIK